MKKTSYFPKRIKLLRFLGRALHSNLSAWLHGGWINRPPLPRAMCLYITYRCNLRCRICGIWQGDTSTDQEISLVELEDILSDRLFSRMEFVNINGGEPNLRSDLPEIVSLLMKKLPRLKTLTMNSNGMPPAKTIQNVAKILDLLENKKIRFSISLSLHKIGQGYDEIAGVKDAFTRVMETFQGLKQLQGEKDLYLSANCVITNLNLFELDRMLEWSDEHKIPLNFTVGEIRDRFLNEGMASDIVISEKDRGELIRFLRKLAHDKKKYQQHALRYSRLADMLETGAPRDLACHYFLGGLILGADGTLNYCKWCPSIGNCRESSAYDLYFQEENLTIRKEQLWQTRCPICPSNSFNAIEAEYDLFKIGKFLLKRDK